MKLNCCSIVFAPFLLLSAAMGIFGQVDQPGNARTHKHESVGSVPHGTSGVVTTGTWSTVPVAAGGMTTGGFTNAVGSLAVGGGGFSGNCVIAMSSITGELVCAGGAGNGMLIAYSADASRSPVVTLVDVRAAAKPISPDKLVPAAYLKLAKSIGLDSAATDEARMLDAIHNLELNVYDAGAVENYLVGQARKLSTAQHGVEIAWEPMRPKDSNLISGIARRTAGSMRILNTSYPHAIPERVITNAARLLECEPDVMFLISNYEAVKPDPFMAVTTPRLLETGKVFIVDQWDEPGFSDGQPVKAAPEKPVAPVPSVIMPGQTIAISVPLQSYGLALQ
jgi:hypothetical protein